MLSRKTRRSHFDNKSLRILTEPDEIAPSQFQSSQEISLKQTQEDKETRNQSKS